MTTEAIPINKYSCYNKAMKKKNHNLNDFEKALQLLEPKRGLISITTLSPHAVSF